MWPQTGLTGSGGSQTLGPESWPRRWSGLSVTSAAHASHATYLEDESTAYRSDTLNHHVEDAFEKADVARDEHAARHCRVDVAAAYMPDGLKQKKNNHLT